MNATERWRGLAIAGTTATAILAMLLTVSAAPAGAAEPAAPTFRETATMTAEQTVTVSETAVVDGFTGHGEATATASASATRTEVWPTASEAWYYAHFLAWYDAFLAAQKKADDQARPIAKQRAEADARAQAAEAAKPKSYTATTTVEQSTTVYETAVVDGFTGHGEATATASATATRTEVWPTATEAWYYASLYAWYDAYQAALKKADDQARPIAKQRAEADARAQAAEAAKPKSYTATTTVEQSTTAYETVVIDGFTGHGEATATASATATRTEVWPTETEAWYYASLYAWYDAYQAALKKADDQARPIAKQRAEADARAQIAEDAKPKSYTATKTVEQTATVREGYTIGDIVGHGEATATASATKTVTYTAAALWEAKYWAENNATEEATAAALADAKAKAKEQALALAKADAERQVQEQQAGTQPGGSSPDCGTQVLKSDGTPWKCTFTDNFRGSTLNTDTWVPQLTSNSSFQHAGECFVNDPRTVSVGEGVLKLSTVRTDESFTCNSPGGSYDSRYVAGQVSTTGKFAQTYGRIEFRARMTTVDKRGLHAALWMWPQDDTAYGGAPAAGEIDVAEIFSEFPDRAVPMIHYNSPLGLNLTGRTNTTCKVDPTEWNTYTAVWTPRGITISYNGTVCLDHVWNTLAPLVGSQPFDKPFFLVLTQTIGSASNAIDPDDPPAGTSLLVDYVKAWS